MSHPQTPYLSLEGHEGGAPEGPEFRAAFDAITAVGRTLHDALVKAGLAKSLAGEVKKLFTFKRQAQSWHWKLVMPVPRAVSNTSLELAKHVAGTQAQIELVRPTSPTSIHPARRPASAASPKAEKTERAARRSRPLKGLPPCPGARDAIQLPW